tara:strand:- start:745 stop:1158 length:414 start_codon:yes stop_codon:yes gene_type:complete
MKTDNFKTRLSENKFDVSLFGEKTIIDYIDSSKIDYVNVSDLVVSWDFYIEMRSWGVKDMGAYAIEVYTDKLNGKPIIQLDIEYYNNNDWSGDTMRKTIDVDISDFKIETERAEKDGTFTITDVHIDFNNKEISVYL